MLEIIQDVCSFMNSFKRPHFEFKEENKKLILRQDLDTEEKCIIIEGTNKESYKNLLAALILYAMDNLQTTKKTL